MNSPTSEGSVLSTRRLSRSLKGSERMRTPLSPETQDFSDEPHLPRFGTMARTKRLILAALRVWELKHGIHD
jgi:hypothetical protein